MKIKHFLIWILIVLTSCSQKEVRLEVTCNYTTNIDSNDDILLLIKQRLITIDSIDYTIKLENKSCKIDIYSKVDTLLLQRVLKNQIKDGYYNIHVNRKLYEKLIKTNDSLGIVKKNEIIKEIRNKKNSSSILGDSIDIIDLKERVFNPLFEVLLPFVDYYGPVDCKNIGIIDIDNYDKACLILSKSSYIPKNTIFMVNNICRDIVSRNLYAIDTTKVYSDSISYRDTSSFQVKIFNNKVQESYKEVVKNKLYGDFDLSKSEIEKYVLIMTNSKYLSIDRIEFKAR